MTWIFLVVGLVLLVVGADLLVKGAARLAGSFGIPALVIGLTVVAFGTSAPELAVSVKAAYSGQAELAIANVVGSNIFNVLFILGAAAMISPLIISRQLIRQDVPIMVLISVVALLMTLDGNITRLEAGVLFAGLLGYTWFLFRQGKAKGADTVDEEVEAMLKAKVPAWQNVLLVIGGLILLVLGARWLVESAVEIARAWGVNEAVIGLTIVAAGTSLPEVVTSIVATVRGERDIAVGNVVGSNIFNILCVLGLSGLVSPVPLLAGAQMAMVDIPVMVGVALLCVPLFFIGSVLNRIEGLLFMLLYVAYTWYLVAMALKEAYLPELQQGILYGLLPLVVLYVVASFIHDRLKNRQLPQ
ncbi:calcium/sodium antiporter [Rheinheimera mesophila]|uniref:Calcium/sodium antiporter n=1 Tax=Rheinheimera mesophila TaxID=1547515 RepID=A0A3P3QQL1_9GAMM|nr:calcium/sodium antiporter [Rheinheimera mesophila]KKL01602.1 sodium:calcium antiporter [Rheinheimera mesophila]RRJ23474.1 calcium/sodium antiporter [Rheinheimera mesophila]